MAFYKAPSTNFFSTTLNGAINNSVDTVTLNSVTGLQAPGVLIINREDGNGTATPSSREIISFANIAGNDLTGCVRNLDGSGAKSHSDGSLVEATFTVGMWNDLRNAVAPALSSDGSGIALSGTASIAVLNTQNIVRFATTSIASIARAQIATNIMTNGIVSNMTISNSLNASGASIVGVFPSAASGALLMSRGNETTPAYSTVRGINLNSTGQQGDFVTQSATPVDVTGATLSITPASTAFVKADAAGNWYDASGTGVNGKIYLLIDGTIIHTLELTPESGTSRQGFALTGGATVTAGTRVIKLQASTGSSHNWHVAESNLSIVWG